jgi:oxygen-independent coproporphyrinogen III oxidase
MSGIYIHIPFCNKRCVYCDFFLVTNKDLIENFLTALRTEIELSGKIFSSEKFDTIYLGGGTPSVLSSEQFYNIISQLKDNLNISSDTEITMEANPEDLFEKDISGYAKAGLNRLSFGVQSFIDDELKFLTREHTSEIAIEAIVRSKEFIKNFNLDIIYSLPGQSIDNLKYSLDKCIALEAKHISAYSLTFEPNTVLSKKLSNGKVKKNTDESESEMFSFIHKFLTGNSFTHYEISNYAAEGFESRHNLKYWNYENYIGLGPSSHSFHNNSRWNNVKNLGQYNSSLAKNILPVENHYILSNDEKRFEYIMLNLRSRGLNLNEYHKMFNENFYDKYNPAVNELLENDLALLSNEKFSLNEKGFVLADEIIAKYF